MKRIMMLFAALFLYMSVAVADDYQVANIYEKQEIPSDYKALDRWGSVKEVKYLLVPTKLKVGKYSVEITRVDSNLYQVVGTELYIETKYCYEYATREDAILVVSSSYGYTSAKLFFLD